MLCTRRNEAVRRIAAIAAESVGAVYSRHDNVNNNGNKTCGTCRKEERCEDIGGRFFSSPIPVETLVTGVA